MPLRLMLNPRDSTTESFWQNMEEDVSAAKPKRQALVAGVCSSK